MNIPILGTVQLKSVAVGIVLVLFVIPFLQRKISKK